MYNISANTIFTGKRQIFLPTCHSTNDIAVDLAKLPTTEEGTLVITPHQTAGKGQHGRNWESAPHQNLSFSIIYHPFFLKPTQQFSFTMAISLGLRTAIESICKNIIKVKWPNDIYLNNKKISGVLIQNSWQGSALKYSVVGIGINVNQELFSDKKAISLKTATGSTIEINGFLSTVLDWIEYYYLKLKSGDNGLLEKEYLQHLYRIGEIHTYKTQVGSWEGTITGVDEHGKLLIRNAHGEQSYGLQEVEYL